MNVTNPASVISWPAYGVSKYLLVVHSEDLNKEIIKEKGNFFYKQNKKAGIKTNSRIAVTTLSDTDPTKLSPQNLLQFN